VREREQELSMMGLDGKSIIVTGAGSGMGRAAALLLAEAGALVTVADIDQPGAVKTVDLINNAGGKASSVLADISDERQVKHLVQSALDTYGHLYGAANVAGVPSREASLVAMTLEEWRRGIEVNLTGTFLCLKYEIAAIQRAGGGAIVNVSSTAAVKAFPDHGEYSAAKAGILSLTRTAAYEVGKAGIRVNCILPGVVDTPMWQRTATAELTALVSKQHLLGRFGQPGEIGTAIRWLLSPEASFVTGALIPIDGGHSAN
jgi:2,5-dichloro-2,5-cyclohexadiene-1,4-diol dehydrogenase 1